MILRLAVNLNIFIQLLRNIFVLLTIIEIDHIVEYLSRSSAIGFWLLLRLQTVDFIDLVFQEKSHFNQVLQFDCMSPMHDFKCLIVAQHGDWDLHEFVDRRSQIARFFHRARVVKQFANFFIC